MAMSVTFIDEVRQMLVPNRGSRHGPLPPLLVGLTIVTGLVDAFSYLLLGHVFVANMTGNVVFLGFALAGATGFSIPASLVALGSFVGGALIGGKVGSGRGRHRGRLLATAASLQGLLLVASVVVAAVSGEPVSGGYRYVLIILLGISIPDLTTTVLTLTITGVAADSAIAGGAGSAAGRRLVAVTAMLVGALAGAALALHVDIVAPLAIALVVTAGVALVSGRAGAADPPWVHPS